MRLRPSDAQNAVLVRSKLKTGSERSCVAGAFAPLSELMPELAHTNRMTLRIPPSTWNREAYWVCRKRVR